MDLGLKGKRVLVMGASSGIGKGVAETLVQEGAKVAICARTKQTLEETRASIDAALAIPCDLSKPGAPKAMIQSLIEKWGGIDVLLINTGGPDKSAFEETTEQQWHAAFQSLWISATESMLAVLPGMKAQKWGRILIVTTLGAKEPLKQLTISNGLRAGLSGLVKSISSEVAPYGVTVNALLPGYTDTDRLRALKLTPETILSLVPTGRLGTTREFGAVAAFLASDLAGYITGQSILVDGGATKGY